MFIHNKVVLVFVVFLVSGVANANNKFNCDEQLNLDKL